MNLSLLTLQAEELNFSQYIPAEEVICYFFPWEHLFWSSLLFFPPVCGDLLLVCYTIIDKGIYFTFYKLSFLVLGSLILDPVRFWFP